MNISLTPTDLINLARYGGGALALFLLLFILLLLFGWIELGTNARREVKFWQEYGIEMKAERDDYRKQIDSRQTVVEQALELASVLKEYRNAPPRRGR